MAIGHGFQGLLEGFSYCHIMQTPQQPSEIVYTNKTSHHNVAYHSNNSSNMYMKMLESI